MTRTERVSGMLRGLAGLALVGLLAACATGATTVKVIDGAVTVAAPPGYCIAPGAGRQGADRAVVVIGRCAGSTRVAPAVLSVSVGGAASAGVLLPGEEALAAYFNSAQGRQTLARSGRAEDVQILAMQAGADAFYLQIRDRELGDYWRAVLGVNGRLVTITATGPDSAPLPPETGRALLGAAVARLHAANGG